MSINDQKDRSSNNKEDNLGHYKIEQRLAEIIWKALIESGMFVEAGMLSDTMINQGCRRVDYLERGLKLLFWLNYLEENEFIAPLDTILH